MKEWTKRELNKQVTEVRWNLKKLDGREYWALLMSDEHWDNKECNRVLLKKHHEEAVRRGAPIFKFGDTFCAMQGKWDKRADSELLRPEHQGNEYLDKLVETAAKWYKPYADNIALITPGNHETSILQRHQTDLTKRLAVELDSSLGDFWGYIVFHFQYQNRAFIINLNYHHGYGGGGEVTRGLIDNSRTRGQYLADIYYSGHIHRRNMDENVVTSINQKGSITQLRQIFLRGSSYKNDTLGWHARTGKAARPMGGWWLKFSPRKDDSLRVDVTPMIAD